MHIAVAVVDAGKADLKCVRQTDVVLIVLCTVLGLYLVSVKRPV